jgi:hypothetical protein
MLTLNGDDNLEAFDTISSYCFTLIMNRTPSPFIVFNRVVIID